MARGAAETAATAPVATMGNAIRAPSAGSCGRGERGYASGACRGAVLCAGAVCWALTVRGLVAVVAVVLAEAGDRGCARMVGISAGRRCRAACRESNGG